MTVLERNEGDFTPGGGWAQTTHAGLLSQTPSSQQQFWPQISAENFIFLQKYSTWTSYRLSSLYRLFWPLGIELFHILSTFLFLAVFEGYSCL